MTPTIRAASCFCRAGVSDDKVFPLSSPPNAAPERVLRPTNSSDRPASIVMATAVLQSRFALVLTWTGMASSCHRAMAKSSLRKPVVFTGRVLRLESTERCPWPRDGLCKIDRSSYRLGIFDRARVWFPADWQVFPESGPWLLSGIIQATNINRVILWRTTICSYVLTSAYVHRVKQYGRRR